MFHKDENGVLSSTGSWDRSSPNCPQPTVHLDITFSGITTIAPRTFAGMGGRDAEGVLALILVGNPISRLTAAAFEGMGQISDIYLNEAQLSLSDSLEQGMFEGLNLRYLDMRNCGLQTLPKMFLKGMQTVEGTEPYFNLLLGNINYGGNSMSGEDLYDALRGYGLVISTLDLSGFDLTSLPGNFFYNASTGSSLMTVTHGAELTLYRRDSAVWECLPNLQPFFQDPGGVQWDSWQKQQFVQMRFNLGVGFDYSNWQQFPECPPREKLSLEPSDLKECAESRTMREVVTGEGPRGFFTGGLGSLADEQYKIWGCFSNHTCLAAVSAPNGSAACFKFNVANGTWSFWQISSDIVSTCLEGRSPRSLGGGSLA